MTTPQPPSRPSHASQFAATHWTVVLAARDREPEQADLALAELCRTYWYPLYAFLRRRGYASHTAEDLTQEFFAHWFARDFLANVDRCKGKFRSFLLAALQNFLADRHTHAAAQKRGGGQTILSLDALQAEARYRLEPAQDLTPERMFQKQWALAILERVLMRLEAELAAEGRSALFAALKETLTGGRGERYAALAATLGMTEGALKTAAHRLRRRYRAILWDEIAPTVEGPDAIQDEIRYLIECL